MTIRIGIDFDNTIAGYDNVFLRVAKEIKLIPSDFEGSKKSIRDAIRKLDDGENKWQCLQGRVYGRNMKDAHMIDGVADFLSYCRNLNDVDIYIVSHKTEYGHYDPMKINLRDAAMSWRSCSASHLRECVIAFNALSWKRCRNKNCSTATVFEYTFWKCKNIFYNE